jgi:hypothetical protein
VAAVAASRAQSRPRCARCSATVQPRRTVRILEQRVDYLVEPVMFRRPLKPSAAAGVNSRRHRSAALGDRATNAADILAPVTTQADFAARDARGDVDRHLRYSPIAVESPRLDTETLRHGRADSRTASRARRHGDGVDRRQQPPWLLFGAARLAAPSPAAPTLTGQAASPAPPRPELAAVQAATAISAAQMRRSPSPATTASLDSGDHRHGVRKISSGAPRCGRTQNGLRAHRAWNAACTTGSTPVPRVERHERPRRHRTRGVGHAASAPRARRRRDRRSHRPRSRTRPRRAPRARPRARAAP